MIQFIVLRQNELDFYNLGYIFAHYGSGWGLGYVTLGWARFP